jgi:hypothetical protein
MTPPAGPDPADASTYSELYRSGEGSARPRGAGDERAAGSSWRWFSLNLGAGLPLGFLWWVLAPGGLNLITRDASLASGTNSQTWLPRDLVLAGLFVLTGCLVAVLLTSRRTGPLRPPSIVLAVAGSALGAVLAWRVGLLAAEWWGAAEDASANPSIVFSLRSHAVLLLWPAAIAATTFGITLVRLLRDHRR